jgi:hypothetical protein
MRRKITHRRRAPHQPKGTEPMTTMQQTPLPTTAQDQETINLDAWRIINTLVVVRGWRHDDVAARICRGQGAVSGVSTTVSSTARPRCWTIFAR